MVSERETKLTVAEIVPPCCHRELGLLGASRAVLPSRLTVAEIVPPCCHRELGLLGASRA